MRRPDPPDWATYAACPTCLAPAGLPCVSKILRGDGIRLNAPHPLRDTTAQPSLFETQTQEPKP